MKADGERPIAARVTVLALEYALLVLMLRCAEGTALSLFLSGLGAERLPWAFLVASAADLVFSLLYVRVVRVVPGMGLVSGLAVLLVVALGAARLAPAAIAQAATFAAYVATSVVSTFVTIHWGVVLVDFFSARESRTAFPMVYAGAHAGSMGAGLALRFLAGPLDARDLLIAGPAVAALGAIVLGIAAGRLSEGRPLRQGQTGGGSGASTGSEDVGGAEGAGARGGALPAGSVRGIAFLMGSPLVRAIAASTAIMVLLRLAMRTCYGEGLEGAFLSPGALTRFLGTYTMVASAAAAVLQILVTPGLLKRLGLGVVNCAYAACVAVTFAAMALAPGLASATAARFADLDLKDAVKTPLSAMFYEAVPRHARAGARALVIGMVSPAASLASSLVLVITAGVEVPFAWIAWVGAALALGFFALSWLQGREYAAQIGRTLTSWLHDRRGAGPEPTIDEAVGEALGSDDTRIADMAHELKRLA